MEYVRVLSRHGVGGSLVSYTFTNNAVYSYDLASGVVDASGNVWFSTGNGSTLMRVDMATGAVSTIAGVSGGNLGVSPDGQTLSIIGGGSITRINTQTQAVISTAGLSRSVWLNSNISPGVDISGAAYVQEYSALVKISPDGQVSTLSFTPATSLDKVWGVDHQNANLLWVSDTTGMATVDLTTLAFTRKDSQAVIYGAVELTGGFSEVVSGAPYSSGAPYFVSRLP